MDEKHFDKVLDFGIFDNKQASAIDLSEIPMDVDFEVYKYFTKVKTQDGKVLLFRSKFSSVRPNVGDIGFVEGKRIMDGKIPLVDGEWLVLVERGFLTKWLRLEKYRDKRKEVSFQVETVFPYGTQKTNMVYVDGNLAPDGKYLTSKFNSIDVKDGKIVDPLEGINTVIRPDFFIRSFIGIFGLSLLLGSLFFITHFNSKGIFEILISTIGVLLMIPAVAGIYFGFFYKIIDEKDTLYLGSNFRNKTLEKKNVEGYFLIKDQEATDSFSYIVIKMKSGKYEEFNASYYGNNLLPLRTEIAKNFKILSPSEKFIYRQYKRKNNQYLVLVLFSMIAVFAVIIGIFLLKYSVSSSSPISYKLLSTFIVIFGSGFVLHYFIKLKDNHS